MGIDWGHHEHTRRGWFKEAARGLWSLVAGIEFGRRLVGQVPGANLTGTVRDSSGAVVPGATVTITNKENGVRRESQTDSDGRYGFAVLPVGTYDITVTVAGYASATLQDVSLAIGYATTADVRLGVGIIGIDPTRITGRQFLVGDSQEETGYGLYSYVLLGSPPGEATRERLVVLMREYLALPETVQLKKAVPMGQLNVTYLPLAKRPSAVEPDPILESYNYVRAQVLLAKIPMGPHVEGPYVISSEVPLTSSAVLSGRYLYQDLSSIPAPIIVLWIREFMKQSSKKDYWRKRDGPQAALQLRTAIARLAAGVDPVKKSVKEWQGILADLVSWKPGSAERR